MIRRFAPLLLALSPLFSTAADGDSIRVYNWNDYIAPEVLERFQRETGIAVDYRTFSTAEELDAVLASGEPVDIAVPSHNNLPALLAAGRLQPLDFSKLPNRKHLDRELLTKLAAVDADNLHAVPYLWGAVGLAINQPKAEAAYGGPLPQSWSLLFDPAQSARLKSCGVSTLDAPEEVMSVLFNYQGRSLARAAPARIKRAGELLQQVRANLRYVDSERYIDDLDNGNLCMALAWVGDALGAARNGQPVKFVIPEEGSVLFIDNLVIPSNAPHPDLAHRFIDYLMRPEVAAQITRETLYPSGNADARQFLDSSLSNEPALYPDTELKRRLHVLETLPAKQTEVREAVWKRFRDGA